MTDVEKLQLMEQNLQNYSKKRQQFQLQLKEVESALQEISNSKESYKIVGNIMVSSTKEDLEKELREKKKNYELRVSSLKKQEEQIKEKAKELQEKVMKDGGN